MVKETGSLVDGVVRILNAVEQGADRATVNDAYRTILAGMTKIEECMEGMSTNALQPLYNMHSNSTHIDT